MKHKTLKLITTILDYPDDHSAMMDRFKRLAREAMDELSQDSSPDSLGGPDFSQQINETKKLWDLQRKL